MIIPDVNLLLYAVFTGYPQHARARAWWEQSINSHAHIGLSHPVLFGFLRIATNPRVHASPMAIEAAAGYMRGWLAQPNVELLPPGPNHLETVLGLLQDIGSAGNLTTDAQIAAYAIEYRGELFTNDTDFAKFPRLKWSNPLK
ncbi:MULTISPECIES: type II toxin-antitoxin system VapC family toxin [unclassified Pseudofrankia]|uniref:type II toxin-antitoxin system VapC family toxin n=1 Tax=unclassified Pseudofrankia TaxID=2994372 RepID=UPI0008D8E801|nr:MULTISPECIES: type II toxin-antitoxin system VapC family toxin [unclassified Pseudofrankia]MDT3440099.1 type II toxin-antitoxin system VapC family toxin [Pseudofrankia sp. BMG5.37]OHV44712.1 ribonuclease [Pseudofrankia sp. BMG5.36]